MYSVTVADVTPAKCPASETGAPSASSTRHLTGTVAPALARAARVALSGSSQEIGSQSARYAARERAPSSGMA